MTALRTDTAKPGTSAGESLADAVLASVPPVVLPPLLAPSAGAFAAAAVLGFGFANQMAGAYLGFLKGAVESSKLMAQALGLPETLDEDAPIPSSVPQPVKNETATILPLARKVSEPGMPIGMIADTAPFPVSGKTIKRVSKPATAQVERAPSSLDKASGKPARQAKTKVDLTDLKRIAGIGPKLEQMLKSRGLQTLADIAALKPDAIAVLDQELGLEGRIERDGWVAKAVALC